MVIRGIGVVPFPELHLGDTERVVFLNKNRPLTVAKERWMTNVL